MQLRFVTSLSNAAQGRDITGNFVRMLSGTTHIISTVDLDYFVSRPKLFAVSAIDVDIGAFQLDANGIPNGFLQPGGGVKLFSQLVAENVNFAPINTQIAALGTVNTAQNQSISTLQGNIVTLTAENARLNTANIALGTALAAVQAGAISLNEDQVAPTVTNLKFTALIKGAFDNLLSALAVGIPVINGVIRYPFDATFTIIGQGQSIILAANQNLVIPIPIIFNDNGFISFAINSSISDTN